MTTPWPPRRTARRPLAPRVAAPREPVDPARIGRRAVRRRAKGRDAAALEDARFDARQDSRHEDLADDVSGRAELAEWERLDQLLATALADTVYDPVTDPVRTSSPPTARPPYARRSGSPPAPPSSRALR
ncbi:hypothetical protein ACIQUL_34290 [Streptomyces sp. NPDC090303]|uniref:hypothetical protein n=1 Tax=Streptomyces sp. NPDC090303 TaxID=3365960 RepID=UPI003820DE06